MRSRNRIIVTSVVAFVVLTIGVLASLLLRQSANSPHSLLLYTNYQSPEAVINWIVDTDTGEKWEVGKGLATGGWSPSGSNLFYYTLLPVPTEIWVSDNTGGNMRQVFNSRQYPDLEVKGYDWLTDEIILVNVFSNSENYGLLYSLNINTLSFNKVGQGNFLHISNHSQFWIQWIGQDVLADLSQKTMPLPTYLSDYYFSPTENKIAYSCAGKYKFSSLCVADISMSGITNEYRVVENAFLNAYGETWWSLDGKYIGFLYSPEGAKETKFKAIDVSNGTTVFDWEFPTKTTRIFWSPRGDKIIDWGGLLLNLKTGQVSDFFAEIGETTPSYIVDWRMIEVP